MGLPNKPLVVGKGRPGPRHSALALDGVDEGRLLAAHEGAGALLDEHLDLEPAVQHVAAEQAVAARLGDGVLQTADRQGVFGADVDIGLGGADGVGRDRQSLQEPVRVALDHGPVHEGARIALVRVADEVLLVRGLVQRQFPFHARGESAPAPAAEPAVMDDLAHLAGRPVVEDRRQGAVSARGDVRLEARGIEHAAVGQHAARLGREKGVFVEKGNAFPRLKRSMPVLADAAPGRRRSTEHRGQDGFDFILSGFSEG